MKQSIILKLGVSALLTLVVNSKWSPAPLRVSGLIGLTICGVVVLTLSILRFQKRLVS